MKEIRIEKILNEFLKGKYNSLILDYINNDLLGDLTQQAKILKIKSQILTICPALSILIDLDNLSSLFNNYMLNFLLYAEKIKKLKSLGLTNPHTQTMSQIKETMKLLNENFIQATILYNEKLTLLNTHSTHVEGLLEYAKKNYDKAKEAYDTYMDALLLEPTIQYSGKEERENADYLAEIGEGFISAFTDNGANTLAISGASFATGFITTATTTITGVSIGLAGIPLAIIGISYTLKEGAEKDKYTT